MASIPEIVARGQQFQLVRQDQSLKRFNGSEKIIVNRPAFWAFSIPVLPRSNVEAKKWRAAIVELANPENNFEATPPGYRGSEYARARITQPTPLTLSDDTELELSNGTLLEINPGFLGGGEINVDGAGQLGKSLNVKNADPNETLFKPGEYFSLDGELKAVTQLCESDGNGDATIFFEPSLRKSPDDNLLIEIGAPFARFRIQPQTGWTLQPNRLHSFTLEATESY